MIELTEKPLNAERLTAAVCRDSNGAVVTFLGNTRDNFEGKRVLLLEYEAYEPMAVKKLEEVRRQVCAEFQIDDIAIGHRIGRVPIGETSLVVAVGSPHRKEAFLACHRAVDLIKEVVPIWKKEIYEDGSRWVQCENEAFNPLAHQHGARASAP